MADVLSSSLAISNTRLGFNCQSQTYTTSNNHVYRPMWRYIHFCECGTRKISKIDRLSATTFGLDMVLESPENRHSWFEVTKPRILQAGLLVGSSHVNKCHAVPHKVASVELGSVCKEQKKVVLEQKKECDENSLKLSVPPWGSLGNDQESDFQTTDVNLPSKFSDGIGTANGHGLYFLEETNEEILSNRILRLSRSNKIRSALELFRSMELLGLRPNLHACNSVLSCLLRNDMLDDALKIFEFMKTSGMTSGHTYSLILKAVANAQGHDAALDLFDTFDRDSNIRKDFDAVVYNTVIAICGKANNWFQAERIWRHLNENGYVGTLVTYRLLVCLFVRCGQNELALDAYHQMIQNGLRPSGDAMQAIIGACTKEGKWDLALDVFQDMLDSGLKPSLVTCNALINSLGKDGNVKVALRIYGLTKSLGHTPDVYTWNALLSALCRANQHADALRLFENIQKKQSSVLNLQLYNTTLMSCHRLGLWDRALQLLWQMEASGIPVSTASYNFVIGACEVARKPRVALQVYEHMVHQRHTPDMFTLLSLIRSCIWGSLWDEVEEILNVGPNGSLYNAVIQGMCLRGKIDSAKKLYKKMRERGLKPDGKTRALMLQNLPKKLLI